MQEYAAHKCHEFICCACECYSTVHPAGRRANHYRVLQLTYSVVDVLNSVGCFAGMNIYAAIFIIPFTVVVYTSIGGLKVCNLAFTEHVQQLCQVACITCKLKLQVYHPTGTCSFGSPDLSTFKDYVQPGDVTPQFSQSRFFRCGMRACILQSGMHCHASPRLQQGADL